MNFKKINIILFSICALGLSSCYKKESKPSMVENKTSKQEKTNLNKKDIVKEKKKDKKQPDLTNTIVSYEKHDDHWHVELSNGKTMITYKDPKTIFPKEAFINKTDKQVKKPNVQKELISWYRHEDHWHLNYSDGSSEISYNEPFLTSKNKDEIIGLEIKPEDVKENYFSNELFEKVIDHKDHIHVFVNGVEYSITKQLYDYFMKNKKFDEVLARGLEGLCYHEIQDESLKAQVEYISKVYGVKLEAIRVSESYFSFNDPFHDYDPSHIHPYFVPRELFYIPLVTGVAELDFENELLSLSYRSGIPVSSIAVKDGKFVLPHQDHEHYVYIQSSGYQEYIKNKKPDINGPYIKGELDESVVLNGIETLKLLVESKYPNQLEMRRVMRVLEDFEYRFNTLKSNSTQGYLGILNKFRDIYINGNQNINDVIENDDEKAYQKLLKDISLKKPNFFTSINVDKNKLIEDINNHAEDENKIYEYSYKLKEYERFSGETAIVGMGYVKFFFENFENEKVMPHIRNDIASLMIRVSDKDFFGMMNEVEKMVDLNIDLNKSLLLEKTYDQNQDQNEDYQRFNTGGYRQKVEKFLVEVENYIRPIENPEPDKLAKDLEFKTEENDTSKESTIIEKENIQANDSDKENNDNQEIITNIEDVKLEQETEIKNNNETITEDKKISF